MWKYSFTGIFVLFSLFAQASGIFTTGFSRKVVLGGGGGTSITFSWTLAPANSINIDGVLYGGTGSVTKTCTSFSAEILGGGGANGLSLDYGSGGAGGTGGKIVATFTATAGTYTIIPAGTATAAAVDGASCTGYNTGGGGGGYSAVYKGAVYAEAGGGGGGGTSAWFDDCWIDYDGEPGTVGSSYSGSTGGTAGSGGLMATPYNGSAGGPGGTNSSGVTVTLATSGGGSASSGSVVITTTP